MPQCQTRVLDRGLVQSPPSLNPVMIARNSVFQNLLLDVMARNRQCLEISASSTSDRATQRSGAYADVLGSKPNRRTYAGDRFRRLLPCGTTELDDGMRKYQSLAVGSANGSIRPRAAVRGCFDERAVCAGMRSRPKCDGCPKCGELPYSLRIRPSQTMDFASDQMRYPLFCGSWHLRSCSERGMLPKSQAGSNQ
jgi:hypothetical protein